MTAFWFLVCKLKEFYRFWGRWPSTYPANPIEARLAIFRSAQIRRYEKANNENLRKNKKRMTPQQKKSLLDIDDTVFTRGYQDRNPGTFCFVRKHTRH